VEVAPLLRLAPGNDVFNSLYWLGIQGIFSKGMAALYNDPKWAYAVEEQLAAS